VAESSTIAFGRYLKQLRERRGLSISRVCEISRCSPEPFDKGTLSRLERGQQTPLIFRLGPLSRIYEIPAEALLERMELDREVDRLGGPDTHDKGFETLAGAGADASGRGSRWEAYAFFRDALVVAVPGKTLTAWFNLATAIRALGKNALALHELNALEGGGGLDAAQVAMVHERMSHCCRCLGELRRAEEYAEAAIGEARALGDPRALAHALATRGSAAIDQEQWAAAEGFLTEGLAAYRSAAGQSSRVVESPSFEAHAMLMLAECSLGLGNHARAQRLATAADRMSREHDLPVARAYSELILGYVDEAAGRLKSALARWRRARTLAARVDSPRIAFAAEVEFFRQAQLAGDTAEAASARRRLDRLAPWIPRHIPAFRRFKQLTREGDTHVEHRQVSKGGVVAFDHFDSGRRRNDQPSKRAGRPRGEHPGTW
jgi:transcriptional regulator with XRE-family HTH domain